MASADSTTVLVTGATDGLGRSLSKALVDRGATVLVHGRDAGKTEETVAELGGTDDGPVKGYVADFGSLSEVRRLAREVGEGTESLQVLVNNAGVGGIERTESADGYELHFAVNHLAHFLLTEELLPLLRRSAPARIVNVSSGAQTPIDFDDPMLSRGYQPMRGYGQSKLAQVLFTVELAERLRADGEEEVTVNALHPATLMDTKMVHENFGGASSSVEEGVEATLNLALSPDLDAVTGRFFNGLEESAANQQAYDEDARRRLWELSEQLIADAG